LLQANGYVETPAEIVDLMVSKLFKFRPPSLQDKVLDPGCGKGAFIDGIIRWCTASNTPLPKIVGVELDMRHVQDTIAKYSDFPCISIKNEDFLVPNNYTDAEKYDFIICNPPYVPITKLSENERNRYRALYESARGRFDLYLLFFERALRCLKFGGRLVFITPEKFLYVETARRLRILLSSKLVEEVHLLHERVFRKLVTYPTITTVVNEFRLSKTSLILRNGDSANVVFPLDGSSWLPYNELSIIHSKYTLQDICERISCGVATGADSVFVKDRDALDTTLRRFAYPTVSGRELSISDWKTHPKHFMLVPYSKDGKLMSQKALSTLIPYLLKPEIREKLEKRTCVARNKPWYAFHENPPLHSILKPKILCKDIAKRPYFYVDKEGAIVPRHSTYYIVPRDCFIIDDLCDYLNSEEVRKWLESHCQRAANAFLRMQSHILKRLPIPARLAQSSVTAVCRERRRQTLEQVECSN